MAAKSHYELQHQPCPSVSTRFAFGDYSPVTLTPPVPTPSPTPPADVGSQFTVIETSRGGYEPHRTDYSDPGALVASSSSALGSATLQVTFGRIPITDISLDDKPMTLGEGNFGAVFRGLWNGIPVAVKQPKLDERHVSREDFIQECQHIATMVNHPHVVRFIGITETGGPSCRLELVTQFYERGSLAGVLADQKRNSLSVFTRARIARDVASALAYLHGIDIIHCDIAARNVLLDGMHRAYLGDFGLARRPDVSLALSSGHLCWTAPELLLAQTVENGLKYIICTRASDIWSFGVLLFEIITRKEPYSDLDKHLEYDTAAKQLKDGVYRIELTARERAFSPQLAALMDTCLSASPEARGSMRDHLATLNSYLDTIPATVSDDPIFVAKFEKLYDMKFKMARDRVFAAITDVPFAPPASEFHLALAKKHYSRESPHWLLFEEARTLGRAVLQYLMLNMVQQRVAPNFLADSGLCRAQNVFSFIMPLEVMNFKIITGRDWVLDSWADLFAHADDSVIGWQYWFKIMSEEGWAKSAEQFLNRDASGALPDRLDTFSTADLKFLDSQATCTSSQ